MGSIAGTESTISTGDILISHLNNLELEKSDGPSGIVRFDMGEISHTKYGKALIQGTFDLVLPEGVFKYPSIESKQRAFNEIVDWFDSNGLDFFGEEDRDNLIWTAIDTMSSIASVDQFGINSPPMLTFIALSILAYFADDIFESTFLESQMSLMSESSASGQNAFMKPVNDTLLGKYKNIDNLPNFEFPMLQPVLWLAFLANEQGNKFRPDFDTTLRHLIKEQEKTAKATFLLGDEKFMDKCSNETYLSLREYDVGTRNGMEVLAVLHQINLSKEIRSNLIFKRLRSAVSRQFGMMNDLFGIEKEMDLKCPNNIILREVTKEKLSLQEAVDQIINCIWVELKDLLECCYKLEDLFPEDENLVIYLNALKYSIDGQVHLYGTSTRWGKPSLKFTYN